ncbi:MAG: protein rep [Bacteroidales bacterium]
MAEIKNLKKHLPERSKFYETGETLEDRTADGKPINWRADKLKNIEVAEMLARLKKDKDGRVLNCGTLLEFKNRADGTKKLNRAYFCKNRLCPSCNKRKAWKRTGEISAVLDKAMQENPTGRFIFLTLTVENAYTAEQLAREIKEINSAFSKMIRYKKIAKNLLGYIRATEVTVNHENKQAGKYHHHIHAIMFVKATYFSKNNYITQVEYTELWQKALRSETPNIVNVKVIKPDADGNYTSAAMETGKYTVKDADYMTGRYLADLETVSDLSEALKGTRDISYGGILRKIKQDISKISITDNDTESETAGGQIIQAHWYWTKENYYIWRQKTKDQADKKDAKQMTQKIS